MNTMKSVIIGLSVALAAVIGYSVYLHQGPIKNISTENQDLLGKIDQMKAASKDLNSTHQTELITQTRQVKQLESQTKALEETIVRVSEEKKLVETELEKLVSQIRKEKESIEADLQLKVGGLEDQLAQKQNELKISHNETQQLKAALEKVKADHQSELTDKIKFVEDLQRKSADLEETVLLTRKETETIEAELRGTIERLEHQLAQRERELQLSRNDSQQQKAASDEVTAAYKAELAAKIRLVEELKKKSTELEETISQIKKETDSMAADLQATITGLENQLAQWDRELQMSREEVQQLRRTITSMESSEGRLRQSLADNNQKLAAAGDQINELQNESADRQAKLSRAEKSNRELKEQVDSLEAEKDQLELARIEVEKQLTESQNRIQAISIDLAARDEKLSKMESEHQQLQKETADRQVKLSRAEKDNRALKEQVDSLDAEKDQLDLARIDVENQLTESQNRIQAISIDLAARDEKLSKMESERQQLLSRITSLSLEKEELARLKDGLRNQLGMSQSQIETLSMDAATKAEQLESKEQQLISMEKAYQELSRQFKQQISEKEIKISTLENKLNIRLLDKILFASGSADVTPDGGGVLNRLATELQKMQGFEISVAGHTDNMLLGPKIKSVYNDNLGLSIARAAAVSRKLREMGVSPANLSATGYSMYRPLISNATKEGRQQNRRVEIMLEPLR